ncbi:MAG: MazG nucleotide pyrophosphohydrolase domain-containing protein [Candidatus Gracilibacteria bacterium]
MKRSKTKKTFSDLTRLAAKLRSPTGCPWDRKQTVKSMLEHLKEEADEVCDAIDKGDHPNLQEELGDLLFQIVMIAQIAKEKKLFDISNVTDGIAQKIVCRHTWVFGKEKAKTPEEAVKMWNLNKAKEKVRPS